MNIYQLTEALNLTEKSRYDMEDFVKSYCDDSAFLEGCEEEMYDFAHDTAQIVETNNDAWEFADLYQLNAARTAIYQDKVLYPLLGLGSEAGEVLGKASKLVRDKEGLLNISDEDKNQLKKELGDVLWMVAALCTDLGFKLSDVMKANLEKLFDRKSRGVLQGSGDNR